MSELRIAGVVILFVGLVVGFTASSSAGSILVILGFFFTLPLKKWFDDGASEGAARRTAATQSHRGVPSSNTAGKSVTPEAVAEIVGDGIAKAFSCEGFTGMFKEGDFEKAWSLNDALAAWYSLGNLALVVSVWTAFDDKNKAHRLIKHSRSVLRSRWDMSAQVFEKLQAIAGKTEAEAFRGFTSCKNGTELFTFFSNYVSMILGAYVPFSNSRFESEMQGLRPRGEDPHTIGGTFRLFVDVVSRTKELLENVPIDWSVPEPEVATAFQSK